MSNTGTLVEGLNMSKKSASAPRFTSSPAETSTQPEYVALGLVEVPTTPLPVKERSTEAEASTFKLIPADAMPSKASMLN